VTLGAAGAGAGGGCCTAAAAETAQDVADTGAGSGDDIAHGFTPSGRSGRRLAPVEDLPDLLAVEVLVASWLSFYFARKASFSAPALNHTANQYSESVASRKRLFSCLARSR